MVEIWKPVPSLPGVMASSEGRIILPPRHAPMHHGGMRLYLPKPTFGQQRTSKKGASHVYMGLFAQAFGNIKVHQAVCEAFHGAKPFPRAVVMHLDESGLNNRPENLRWGTQKENLNAPGFVAKCKARTGDRSPRAIAVARREAA